MRKPLAFIISVILIAGLAAPAHAADKQELDAAIDSTAAYLLSVVKNPQVDPVGGEWAVMGLARSGYGVSDAYFENYYRTVEKYVKDNDGILHDKKYTEYSRVIIGLTAAGYDARDVAGYDLTAPLEDFANTVWQGINGPVFALIALDSMDYPNSRRDDYITEILRRQLSDGGWNLTAGANGIPGSGEKADPDITGMALQALAKYQDKPEVKAAVDKALSFLSASQDKDGGYSSWGSMNSESVVQVLVALCELGVSVGDARFVKNGNTLVDNVLSFSNADGSFRHTTDGSGNSQMSTEQAFYGLVAARRAAAGKNSLYRMGDTVRRGGSAPPAEGTGLPGKHPDVVVAPVGKPGRTFADVQNHRNQTAIETLAARGIINGKSENSFDPDATMKRAEIAAIVAWGLGLPEKAASPFDDVPDESWYAKAVATAYHYAIVNGTSAVTFNPNGTITRQEAAVMVAYAAKLCGIETDRTDPAVRDMLAQFGDYRRVADWAQSSLAFCYDTGILDDDALEIGPTEAIKRCEIAEMLYRMLYRAELLQES